MSQTADVNTGRWPIAPDGYIPNSVIRGWRKKKKHLPQTESSDEDPTNNQDAPSWRVKEGEGQTGEVKARKKESEDEEAVVERRKRIVFLKESYAVQTKISQQKTSDDGWMNVEEEVGYVKRKSVNFVQISRNQKENKQRREQTEESPLQHLDNRRTATFMSNASPVESPAVSAEDVLSKQEARTTLYIPPRDPQNVTPHPRKPPSPTPVNTQPQPDIGPHPSLTPEDPQPDLGLHFSLTPEDHQPDLGLHFSLTPEDHQPDIGPHPSLTPGDPQTDHGPNPLMRPSPTPVNAQPQPPHPEISAIGYKRFLLSSTKYDNVESQKQVPLDQRVLELYRKFKAGTKNSSRLGNISIVIERPLASLPSSVRSNSAGLMSKWRKNQHNPLQGFCSPAAGRELQVESSDAGQLAATAPSLWLGEAAAHQRVVQRFKMTDTMDPPCSHFHHVIPMNAQQTFFPLNPRGKTRYGRLQFDWMRGA